MLELQNLTKQYGKFTALSDVSAVLKDGVYGLLGPNGAGKSTLMNLLVMLKQPTDGEILFDGAPIRRQKEHYLNCIGYMPQYSGFYKNFTAQEYLLYFCAVKGLPKNSWHNRCGELLGFVNLSNCADKKIGGFSGGMRQRLAIAQALLNDPRILILDEPTAGLDPKERIRFRNMLSELSANRCILLATHIVPDIEYIANEVILLKAGKKIAQETPDILVKQMQGRVWELTVPEAKILPLTARYSISNVRHREDSYALRIVSEEAPDPSAIAVPPNLDDVYLYYFEENSI